MSISDKQLAANRRNAKKSIGPKSEAGKDRSKMNAVKHGLQANTVVINAPEFGESNEVFDQLHQELRDDLQPVGRLEKIKVEEIATLTWRLKRAQRAENGEIKNNRKIAEQAHELQIRNAFGMSTINESSNAAYKLLSQSTEGIIELEELVHNAQQELLDSPTLSHKTVQGLSWTFGTRHGNFVKPLRELNDWAKKGLELRKQDPPKKLKDKPRPEECGKQMQDLLERVWDELDTMLPEVTQKELADYKTEIDRQCIPGEQAAGRILRYETSIRKMRDKAIDLLLKLQKKRLS